MITYKLLLIFDGTTFGTGSNATYNVPLWYADAGEGNTISGYPASVAYTSYSGGIVDGVEVWYFTVTPPNMTVTVVTPDDAPFPSPTVAYQSDKAGTAFVLEVAFCNASTCSCNGIGWGTNNTAAAFAGSGLVAQSGNVVGK